MSLDDEFLHLNAAAPNSQYLSPLYIGYIVSYDPIQGTAIIINPLNSNIDTTGQSDSPVVATLSQELPLLTSWGARADGTNPLRNDILPYGLQICPFGGSSIKEPTKGEPVLVVELNPEFGAGVIVAMMFPDLAPPVGSKAVPVSGLTLTNGEMLLITPGGVIIHMTMDGSVNLFSLPLPPVGDNPAVGGNINAVAGGGVNIFAQKTPTYIVPQPFTINVHGDQEVNITSPSVQIIAQNPIPGSPNLSQVLLEALGLNGYAQSLADIEIIARSGITTQDGTANVNIEAIAQDSPAIATSTTFLRSHAGGVVSGIANAFTEIDVQANNSGVQNSTLSMSANSGLFGAYNPSDQAATLLFSEGYNTTTTINAGDTRNNPTKAVNSILNVAAIGLTSANTSVTATTAGSGTTAIVGLTAQNTGSTGASSAAVNALGNSSSQAVMLAQSTSSGATESGVYLTADGETNSNPANLIMIAKGTVPIVSLTSQGSSGASADSEMTIASLGGGGNGATITMLSDGTTNSANQANISASARSGGSGDAAFSATADATNGANGNIVLTATGGSGDGNFNVNINGGTSSGQGAIHFLTTGGVSNGNAITNFNANATGTGTGSIVVASKGGTNGPSALYITSTGNVGGSGGAIDSLIDIVSQGNSGSDLELVSQSATGAATAQLQVFSGAGGGGGVNPSFLNLNADATSGGTGAAGQAILNSSGDATNSFTYVVSDGTIYVNSNGPQGLNLGANAAGPAFLTTNANTLNLLSGQDMFITSVTDMNILPNGNLDIDLTGGTGSVAFNLDLGSPFLIHSTVIQLGTSGTLRDLIDSRVIALFNNHKHSGVATGSGTSGVPTTTLTTANCATTNTQAS